MVMIELEAVGPDILNPPASNCSEAMEKYVPPVTAMSKPSATLPSVLKSVPQEKTPFAQASLPVVALQDERPDPKSWELEAYDVFSRATEKEAPVDMKR